MPNMPMMAMVPRIMTRCMVLLVNVGQVTDHVQVTMIELEVFSINNSLTNRPHDILNK